MTSRDEVRRILTSDGVLVRREHPELDDAVHRLSASGAIASVLPGVYAASTQARDPRLLALAISRDDPRAVVTGWTAAALSYWPECRLPPRVSVAVPVARRPRPGFVFERRYIPDELIIRRGPVQLTAPALTALDLSTMDHSEPMDVALRTRVVTVAQLNRALQLSPGRAGNRERRQLVVESLTNPWSYGERGIQRLLRAERVSGWEANRPTFTSDGRLFFIDVAFEEERVGIEVDGRTHHSGSAFESDRRRNNALVSMGWLLLHVTVGMIEQDPASVMQAIRRTLTQRRRLVPR